MKICNIPLKQSVVSISMIIYVYPLSGFIVFHVLFPNRLSGAPPPGKPSRWRPCGCDAKVPGDKTETKTGENLWKCMEHEEKTIWEHESYQ